MQVTLKYWWLVDAGNDVYVVEGIADEPDGRRVEAIKPKRCSTGRVITCETDNK